MKLFTTFALLSTALLAHAVSTPADLAFPLESRDTCSSPPGENGCGHGRECGDGPGVVSCPFAPLHSCLSQAAYRTLSMDNVLMPYV
jgi:hypothetical protein